MSTPPAKPTCSDGGRLTHFSEEEEVKLLNCYLEMGRSNKKNPTVDSPTLERIQGAMGTAFSHSHIADMLHRLKLRYHKFARTKSFVKTPHHRRILDIGRTIWGKSPTPTPTSTSTTTSPPHPTPRISSRRITQQQQQQRSAATSTTTNKGGVDLNDFPLLVSEFSRHFPGNGVWKKGLQEMEDNRLRAMNQEWALLHSQEAELKATRAALLRRQHTSEDLNYCPN